jgi:hypothetical protein
VTLRAKAEVNERVPEIRGEKERKNINKIRSKGEIRDS